MLLRATSVITPNGEVSGLAVRIENGVVTEFSSDENLTIDLEITGTLIPGFVDIHCHGGGGFYFSSDDVGEIEQAISLHRKNGTVAQYASLVTAPLPEIKEQIKRLIPLVRSGTLKGIHLEGPYLSSLRCGAHDPALLRHPEVREIQELLAMGEGTIAMITIAPELPGALDAIALLAENSVIPALGHSEASPEEMAAGIHAGGQVVTHFHNAMQKFESGKKTSADYLRHDSSLPLELILDGVHVADEIASDLLKNISERTILVTDAMSAAGCPDGQYTIGALEVEVKDQVARLASNGSLAGSTLTMQRVFFNALSMGISLSDVVAMTSTNAAQLAGLNGYGRIEVGAPADFLLLSGDKKSLKVLEL